MSKLDKIPEPELVKMGSIFIDIIGRVGAIDIQPDKYEGLTVRFTDNDKSRVIWFSDSLNAVNNESIRRYAERFRVYDDLDQSEALNNFYGAFYLEQERLSMGKGVLGIKLCEDSIRVIFKRDGFEKRMFISLTEIRLNNESVLRCQARDFFKDFNCF